MRTARLIGRNGYIHICSRGVNHQDIFYHDSDYLKFLELLDEIRQKMGFDVIAYCLMTNHIHLLIHDNEHRFGKIMQQLTFRYAQYFNKKYDRSGHLFQNRYFSRPIDTKSYMLSCVTYIHNNPSNAYICSRDKYKWSSYSEYVKASNTTKLCSTDFVRSLTGSIEEFIAMHDNPNPTELLDEQQFEYGPSLPDGDLRDYLCSVLRSDDPTSIQSLPIKERNHIIANLKKRRISRKQIARITGLSPSVISHAR